MPAFCSWVISYRVLRHLHCQQKRSPKLAAVTLQPRQKKRRETYDFWACTVQFARPLAVMLRGAVWESMSDFQLFEGGGGANRATVSTILSGKQSELARSNYQVSHLRSSDNQITKQNLA